eukprot:CAMPEP_0116832174 /NCGR_PEP_ID=MMETSP0418-20121206/5747_1 /TAXON_ID=1158023 /ORGANISM="Astrosyne radiata, Strain 13vi08-1A" /LENGTH=132 /DNA_ID=CAMNT_0004461509 /DNA_START=199 /DNA_END=593 /DNA_ORIENTATION=+
MTTQGGGSIARFPMEGSAYTPTDESIYTWTTWTDDAGQHRRRQQDDTTETTGPVTVAWEGVSFVTNDRDDDSAQGNGDTHEDEASRRQGFFSRHHRLLMTLLLICLSIILLAFAALVGVVVFNRRTRPLNPS